MTYFLVQNEGEAPVESFTLLGASASRDENDLIGQFGSGAKLAITTLLRKGLGVTIYTGKTRMEFKTREIAIDDGISVRHEQQVYLQYGGTSKRKQDLGWVLGFGALDWQDTEMALREFVANAIDRTVKQGDSVIDAHTEGDLIVSIVPEEAKRAQTGYTRVFIEADDDCRKYVDELKQRFLHFTNTDTTKNILAKKEPGKARIYLEGVYVCTLDNLADSLYDYNFKRDQIKIDESRNLNEYYVRAAIGKLYKDASCVELEKLFHALEDSQKYLETELDPFYLKTYFYEGERCKWRQAWETVHGSNTVACAYDQAYLGDLAMKKGFNLGLVQSSAWIETLKSYGIRTVGDVLDRNERKGRETTPPTFEAIDATKEVWGWVEAAGTTKGKPCPKVRGYDEMSDFESESFGYFVPGEDTIYIRNDVGGKILYETVLEEIAHYCSGATDNSRDFQNFLLRLLVRWLV